MQQALDALKVMRPACFAENTLKTADTAITALRDRLAQPEQTLTCVCGAVWEGELMVHAPRDRLAQPEQELVIDCPRCGHCCPERLIEEMPPPMSKGQAWQKWWYETRGKHMVAGGAHPMEWAMYDAFNSGWDAAKQNSEKD
jgi:hypothetical protein